ncbi:MAG: ABC transporter substrate-binding protein [Ruminococcaceae bacterium]|nr:ABC transporter substrate-binding protein [Oscillospiraceae bacterium]
MRKILKVLAAALAVSAMAFSFGGCGNNTGSGGESSQPNNSSSNSNSSDDSTSGDKLKIGVVQFAAHPSLDNCYNGIVKGLEESEYAGKYTIDLQNGQESTEACDAAAKKMVAANYDMIFAIATPAAVSTYAAAKDNDIPVIFCAVSDPVEAGLTESFDAGFENCVGTSDVLELDKQVDLIKSMQPDVKRLGVLYTTTEANSISQLRKLKEICSGVGIDVVEQGVSGSADIPQAAADLASKVDAINNFTDNNVVSNLSVLLEKANEANVPVYGSEVEQVKNGCMASISIDYVELGRKTAQMGVEVMNGKKCSEMSVQKISEGTPVVNTEVMERFSIELPDSFSNAEKVTTND